MNSGLLARAGAMVVPILVTLGACGGGDGGGGPATEGTLRLTISTQGNAPDPDGYTLHLAGQNVGHVGTSDEVLVDRAPGLVTVALQGLTPNCDAAGDGEHAVVAGDTTEVELVVSCGGRHLAVYQGLGPCTHEVHVVLDGADWSSRVTNNATADTDPTWTTDGARVVYVSYRSGDSTGIWSALPDGSDERLLRNVAAGVRDPELSPDGTRIAYRALAPGVDCIGPCTAMDLFVIPVAAGAPLRLTSSYRDYYHSAPHWSPDGATILFASDTSGDWDIYRVSAGGGTPVPVVDAPGNQVDPSWSPDGSRIAWASFNTSTATAELWVADADGTDAAQVPLTGLGDHLLRDPVWSPDGQRLAFWTEPQTGFFGGRRAWTGAANGGALTQLFPSATGGVTSPAWRP